MRAWMAQPGVPAAGHVTSGGYWHPGRIEGCVKCESVKEVTRVTSPGPQSSTGELLVRFPGGDETGHTVSVSAERFVELSELGIITHDGFVTMQGALWLELLDEPSCPHCHKPLSDDGGVSWPYCSGCNWCPDCPHESA